MHVRVLLSRYRAYTPCTGLRRRAPEARRAAVARRPVATCTSSMLHAARSQCARRSSTRSSCRAPLDEASGPAARRDPLAPRAILCEVGLGYLTLDRQSRTLSGGEVQRINLTTALGTSLVNTLFVLDEPSIGLHPRDMQRVIDVMHRLRDAGNSLVVVEHDPQIMLAADRILDIGPGAGERGGEIVLLGHARADAARHPNRSPAQYLSGATHRGAARAREPRARTRSASHGAGAASVKLRGAQRAQPQGRRRRIPAAAAGVRHRRVGLGQVDADRGRAVPGAAQGERQAEPKRRATFDRARRRRARRRRGDGRPVADRPHHALEPRELRRRVRRDPRAVRRRGPAKERNYTAGTFSFNSGNGRCPTCSGNGFEHVEMQFLSDVYLRCPDCDGRRYPRRDARDRASKARTAAARSIADVLDMTVTEALAFFAARPRGGRAPAAAGRRGPRIPEARPAGADAVGRRGAAPEARRPSRRGGGGRHAVDPRQAVPVRRADHRPALRGHRQAAARVPQAARSRPLAAGDRAQPRRDPRGGLAHRPRPRRRRAGGEIVADGTPAQIWSANARVAHRHGAARTTRARSRELAARAAECGEPLPRCRRLRDDPHRRNSIVVHNAREHNLQQHRRRDSARRRSRSITGVSGSGKSTLAFDIVFNEGQRRYLESLNAYARQFVQPAARPDVDAIYGIPPTVAIEQRTSRGGRKSTVATLTEIYHFLRLLYVKLGTQYCPDCDVPIEPQSAGVDRRAPAEGASRQAHRAARAAGHRSARAIYTELAKWAAGKRLQAAARRRRVPADRPAGRGSPLQGAHDRAAGRPRSSVQPQRRSAELRDAARSRALEHRQGRACTCSTIRREASPRCTVFVDASAPARRAARSFPELDPRLFSFNSKHGWCDELLRHRPRDRGLRRGAERRGRRRGTTWRRAEPHSLRRPATGSG